MPEEKHLLVLANSARAKKHCVAGKIAVPREGGGFTFTKTWNAFEKRHDVKRKLTFTYAGQPHEFSVTYIAFSTRHQIYDRATEEVQTLRSRNPNVWFCLSLTKLTPEFSRKHYKICATLFEL